MARPMMMTRKRHSNKDGDPYHIIGGGVRRGGGGNHIQVLVPAGSQPGSPDFPVCVDCGSDLLADDQYQGDDPPEWCSMTCEECGSIFIVEDE